MVSNVQNSAQTPPLSYADRVKKSQRANAASSTSSQRPQPRSQPSPASAATPPNATKGPKSPDAETAAKQQQGAPPVPADRQPSSLDTPRKAIEQRPVNGQTSSGSVDPVAGPSSTPTKKAAAPHTVNVWSLRKEQMARALSQQTTQGTESSSQARTASANDSGPAPAAPTASSSASASTSVQKEPEVSSSIAPPKTVAADIGAPPEEDDDPWIVRPNRAPAAVPLPRLDATSWPEVGKPASLASDQPGTGGASEKDDRSKRDVQGAGQRRG